MIEVNDIWACTAIENGQVHQLSLKIQIYMT